MNIYTIVLKLLIIYYICIATVGFVLKHVTPLKGQISSLKALSNCLHLLRPFGRARGFN